MCDFEVYTDGACSGNPGPGGWGYVILQNNDLFHEDCGGESQTTNNRMEMTAVIRALRYLAPVPSEIIIYSDSAYLVQAFRLGWIQKWQRNGWKTATGQDVLNQDLWQELVLLTTIHKVTWIKVKAHSGIKWNERCDKLATSFRKRFL